MRSFLHKRFAFKSNITHYDAATNSLDNWDIVRIIEIFPDHKSYERRFHY